MRYLLVLFLFAAGCGSKSKTIAPPAQRTARGLVDVERVAPAIRLDIRYATKNNFTGQVLYPMAACRLKEEVAAALAKVQEALEGQGLGLKVYDCYRPLSVQKFLWKIMPDPRYVADPKKGSRHNRGFAVDLTVVDKKGRELEMPTGYDDFSKKAHRNYEAPKEQAENRAILEKAMLAEGFSGLKTEWWHFDYPGWRNAPILDVPLEDIR